MDLLHEKIRKEVLVKIVEGQVVINNFNDIKAVVVEANKKYNIITIDGVMVDVAARLFANDQNVCNAEFYDICKHSKKVAAYTAAIKLPEVARLDKYTELFSTNVTVRYCKSDPFKKAIDDCIILCNKQEEAKAKAVLKMMNRAFSQFLIADKAGWEPIIAKVRTTLEAY